MADLDQTASEEAVWSRSSLFAILASILLIHTLKTNILFENSNRKVFQILEHLLYKETTKPKTSLHICGKLHFNPLIDSEHREHFPSWWLVH